MLKLPNNFCDNKYIGIQTTTFLRTKRLLERIVSINPNLFWRRPFLFKDPRSRISNDVAEVINDGQEPPFVTFYLPPLHPTPLSQTPEPHLPDNAGATSYKYLRNLAAEEKPIDDIYCHPVCSRLRISFKNYSSSSNNGGKKKNDQNGIPG
ncbi:hypothetical protein CDAR_495521 [Caerostris darwini]|uniref:Uncharacterized protein n=1 Tax=Caerostris darwini TaxID=1538125 RepID=A0AAV4SCG0_9ARAC|nr:hypothetical protein CDAR_495521 [Caerostris darwini]